MADGDCRAKTKCIGEGCVRESWSRGMCKTHYSRWRIHGDCNKVVIRKLPATCEVDGCDRKAHSRWKKGKAVCNPHWQVLYRYGTEVPPPQAPPDPLPLCVVHKCRTEVRSRNSQYCEKHYGRVRRGAPPEDKGAPLHRWLSSKDGYVTLFSPAHPLAGKGGVVREHRVIAYAKHGGVCPGCFWCGRRLEWKAAVVDHLNENKQDNRPENLLVACNPCNRARGAMLPFLADMREEAFGVMVEAMRAYRASKGHVSQLMLGMPAGGGA